MVDEQVIEIMISLFDTIGDRTRMRVLLLLKEKKELNVSQMCDILNIEQSSLSHHLQGLREHSLVKTRRDGRSIYYSLNDDHVLYLLDTTIEHVKHTRQN